MLRIDRRDNITLHKGDNGIIEFSLCGDTLMTNRDTVYFLCDEPGQEQTIQVFLKGVARIYIKPHDEEYNGIYCIRVAMGDGRIATVKTGKYIREGRC